MTGLEAGFTCSRSRIPEIEREEEARTNLRNGEPYTAAYCKYRWIAQSTGRKNEDQVEGGGERSRTRYPRSKMKKEKQREMEEEGKRSWVDTGEKK